MTPRSRPARSHRPVRLAGLAVLGLLAPLALAACGAGDTGAGETSGDGAGAAPLTFQVAGDPEETAVYEAIATAYNDTEPADDNAHGSCESLTEHVPSPG